jgi:hypothetical protein
LRAIVGFGACFKGGLREVVISSHSRFDNRFLEILELVGAFGRKIVHNGEQCLLVRVYRRVPLVFLLTLQGRIG